MNRDHVLSLFASRRLTAAKRDSLLGLLDEGVTDPFLAGVNPGLSKLWYAHLTTNGPRGGAVSGVGDAIIGLVNKYPHYHIAHKLKGMLSCHALNDFLKDWISVTRDPTVLEAVSWGWLTSGGVLEDAKEDATPILSTTMAADSPCLLILLLSRFKRQYDMRHLKPIKIVDALALSQGWWSVDSEVRCDAFVSAAVEETLAEHEWTPVESVLSKVEEGVTQERAIESMDRMERVGSIVRVNGTGITTPDLVHTSRDVKRLAAVYEASDAEPWDEDDESDPLASPTSSAPSSSACGRGAA